MGYATAPKVPATEQLEACLTGCNLVLIPAGVPCRKIMAYNGHMPFVHGTCLETKLSNCPKTCNNCPKIALLYGKYLAAQSLLVLQSIFCFVLRFVGIPIPIISCTSLHRPSFSLAKRSEVPDAAEAGHDPRRFVQHQRRHRQGRRGGMRQVLP